MRRFTLTIATSVTALALLPAGALASGHAAHQRRQHSRHHHVHHGSVRHERFGAVTTGAGSSANSGATGIPTPAENAGTVQSFNAGVLTLSLADGSTVTGRVTDGTEIECEAADMSGMHADGDGGGGQGGADNSGPGSGGNQGQRGDDNGGGDDNGDRGDDNGNDNPTCMTGGLVAGAVVRSAELRISSAGATWDKIELIG
ncbi:MAG: hypothetical protein M3Z06_05840 [Actinomycetota bacterium]|nr:hypothetical protein [Actinomycetota bacterium]